MSQNTERLPSGSLVEKQVALAALKQAHDEAEKNIQRQIAAAAENESHINRPLENHRLLSEDIDRAQGFIPKWQTDIAGQREKANELIGNRNGDGKNVWDLMQPILNLEQAVIETERWISQKKNELSALESHIATVAKTRNLAHRLPDHLKHLAAA